MKLQGLIGGAYTLDSVNVDYQRCVNLYPEVIESGLGKGAQPAYLRGTPGLEELTTVGTGPIRLVHVDLQNRIFVASGSEMYQVTVSGSTWTATKLGDLDTSSGIIKAASCNIDDGATMFVDGTTNYLYWDYTTSQDFGDLTDFGYTGVPTATDIVFIDGYFISNKAGTNQFYVSDLDSFNFGALSFSSSEGDPDNIIGLMNNNRDLWVLNERSIEIYVNTGNADFPFERVQGGFIEQGCLALGSISKIKGNVFWLGRDEFGQGSVYMSNSLTPQRISTHAIEQAISGYASPDEATSYTYEKNGHLFYVLNFDEATWVFDVATGLWHERAYTNSGTLERHRADNCHFYQPLGVHLVGDYSNNKLYKYNETKYTDDGDTITRLRTTPHISSGLKYIFCNSLQLDMETGVGLLTGQGSDPQVMLTYSDDGGHTWSDESWTSAGGKPGGIGEYKKRVLWRRLGKFRDRIFKFKITDPVKVIIIDAELELRQGVS